MGASDVEDGPSRSASPEDSGAEQDTAEMSEQQKIDVQNQKHNGGSSTNAKDPSRPRRKKARRACYACQRAHLTCGDERPCQRCIKRGLQDACQDGVRKKAKYLHDAPNEALMPGVGGNLFNRSTPKRSSSSTQNDTPQQQPQQTGQSFYSQSQGFNVFSPTSQMPPPLMHERSVTSTTYPQHSPINNNFNVNAQAPIQSPGLGEQSSTTTMGATGWSAALFDDPSLFNFDIASMNFGNHYGALEFGMLGHMATNAGETPPSDTTTHRGSIHQQYRVPIGSFSESPSNHHFAYNDALMSDWSNGSGIYNHQMHQGQTNGPNAFAIESSAAHFTSPDTISTPPDGMKFEESPMLTSNALKPAAEIPRTYQPKNGPVDTYTRQPTSISTPQLKAKSQLPVKNLKRPRDPSSIYTSVTNPYAYTAGFHSLVAYLQKRFATSPAKTLAIAKSLASIRPSFIATTKTLNREDLIFMEKCFQRTLWEYEGFIEGVGTPTLVARRTGEVAAVGKEFQILTGWTKSVLLGRTPNLNVNRGHSGNTPAAPGSGSNTAGKATGWNTPTQRTDPETSEKRLQPVFLAELLDDDSVVQFYEDFARLAFGDSRGSVMGKGKLLKYRTKDDELAKNLQAEADARGDHGGRPRSESRSDHKQLDNVPQNRQYDMKKEGISGEKGMQKLGSADGKVDCAYCWTVKRDVFDIPMLIIMNFLPCI